MKLFVKHFSELTARELYEIYKLRVSVFVVEQKCYYQEVDDADPGLGEKEKYGQAPGSDEEPALAVYNSTNPVITPRTGRRTACRSCGIRPWHRP